MFLDDLLKTETGKNITKLQKENCSYNFLYKYWRDQLFERIMRLFVWENTYDPIERKGVPPKEIEMRLVLKGHCGITRYKNDITAFFGSFFNPTKYYDEFTGYTVYCPVYSGTRKIGRDIVIINNNALRNPTYHLVHHYATLLGHTETSLINCLINVRDSGGVPVVSTEKQKQSIIEYQNRIFNGQYGVVTDVGNLGIEYMGGDKNTNQDLMKIMEAREKLIKSFYSDIGVRSAFEKRNNTVMAEVEADTSLLLLNLSDMLKQREDACKQVNAMFGTDWSVHVAEEIDYGTENQRIQFDTTTETHVQEEEENVVDKSESENS